MVLSNFQKKKKNILTTKTNLWACINLYQKTNIHFINSKYLQAPQKRAYKIKFIAFHVINFVATQLSLISNPLPINPSDPRENKLYLLKGELCRELINPFSFLNQPF